MFVSIHLCIDIRYLYVTATPSASTAQEGVTIAPPSVWPADTDLKAVKDSKRLMLTVQTDFVRTVIQNSFEGVRASLLFEHAFPDTILSHTFIRDALITAAANYGSSATMMHARLISDREYIAKIVPLVRIVNSAIT